VPVVAADSWHRYHRALNFMQDKDFRPMAQRSARLHWRILVPVWLPLFLISALLPACWNADSLGRLFGAPPGGGGNGGFDPGVGGGLTLRDLFQGARLLREAPTIVTVAPADKATDVSIKTPITVTFSESMFGNTVRTGLTLFQHGSTTSTASATTLFQDDSVAVLVPQADLLPNTQYDIVIASSVTDLQADPINNGSGSAGEIRFTFTTIASTGDPDFVVAASSPAQQAGQVPRDSEAILVFSEPINVAATGGGINAPGNLVVKRDGATLTLTTDYTMSTFPSANPRGVEIVFTSLAPANSTFEIDVDRDVQSADGLETLKGNAGFQLTYTVQDQAIPADCTFPNAPPVPGKDGAIGAANIHAFTSTVALTGDGSGPDTTTILFFDQAQQNALVFNQTATNPTNFVSDLQPQTTPALLDGDVIVGCYVERRGFRSEVSVIKTLVKDTVGPRLNLIGPPNINSNTIVTQVNDPVIHGRMSEPCAGVSVDFDGGGTADFNSVQFQVGQSTVTNDFFVTGATEDAALPQQLEPKQSFSFICSDLFGNVSVNLDSISNVTVGKVGATVAAPDGATALYVVGYAGDIYQQFVTGAAVLLDSFPPDPSGANQIARGVSASGGIAHFTDADLASIATPLVTVTVVAERTQPSGTIVTFGPVTFAGLVKPTAAAPRAILALLPPEPLLSTTNIVQCDIQNESNNSPLLEIGSAFANDVNVTTPELEKFTLFNPTPGLADNIIPLPLNTLQLFTVVEEFNFGGVQNRFTSSEPFTAENDPGGIGLAKQRTADFAGKATYSDLSNPNLVHTVSFDDASVSNGGSVGLKGSEASTEQFREWRIVARVPGFVGTTGVSETTQFGTSGPTRTAAVLLPQPFLDNDTSTSPGVGSEDSPLELLIQPNLIDPTATVDPVKLRRNLRLELWVQDKLQTGTTTATSAYTRARFLFDATATSNDVATFQSIPVVTPVSLAHPPALSWPEVTNGEGMHCLTLTSAIRTQSWRIYVPAQSGGGTITMQLPNLSPAGGLPDGVGPFDFQIPGVFATWVESFDFDPNHLFGPGAPDQYDFDPQSWFVTDLERECLRSSRSDPKTTITTN
jgi:hypothetical protein